MMMYDVAIIGAGISGLRMAIELRRQEIGGHFTIIETNGDVGGTWYSNSYMGACADAQSHVYSFAFDPNLACSRLFPSRLETMAYLRRLTRQWQLRPHIRFNTSVKSAAWDESKASWRLQLSTGAIEARYLVSATGQLSTPRVPAIPDLHHFPGKVMHSARWDGSAPLTGRVAVVGTGASAVQLIPEVARRAEELHVVQRSPAYILPRNDAEVSWHRRWLWHLLRPLYFRRRSEILAQQESFHAVVMDEDARRFAEGICTQHRVAQVPDSRSELRGRLTPSYMMGCKRILLSDDFYPAMVRENTALHTRAIDRASANGLIIGGEEIFLDTIIFATGFHSQSSPHVPIVGRHGRALGQLWRDGPYAYRGVAVEDMPNFGMLYGPNTNLSHVAVVMGIEAQAAYIARIVASVRQGWTVTPKAGAVRQYNDELQEALRQTSFASPTCRSWYKTEAGKVTSNWPGTAMSYVETMKEVDWAAFHLEPAGGRQPPQRDQGHAAAAGVGYVVAVALGAFLIVICYAVGG